jgi:hypothetical protein
MLKHQGRGSGLLSAMNRLKTEVDETSRKSCFFCFSMHKLTQQTKHLSTFAGDGIAM